jgi:hypothetical protein
MKVLVHLVKLKILRVVGIVELCNKHVKATVNGVAGTAQEKVLVHLVRL